MKDLQHDYAERTVFRRADALAVIKTCKKVDEELLTSGTFVANGAINRVDQDRFGLKVDPGTGDQFELDLSRGSALHIAALIVEHYGLTAQEFEDWVRDSD